MAAQQSEESRQIGFTSLDRVEDALRTVLHDKAAASMLSGVDLKTGDGIPPLMKEESASDVTRQAWRYGQDVAERTRQKIASLFASVYYHSADLPLEWWEFNHIDLLRMVALYGVLDWVSNGKESRMEVAPAIPHVLAHMNQAKAKLGEIRRETQATSKNLKLEEIFYQGPRASVRPAETAEKKPQAAAPPSPAPAPADPNKPRSTASAQFLIVGTKDDKPHAQALVVPAKDVPQFVKDAHAGIEGASWSGVNRPEWDGELRTFLEDPKWKQSQRIHEVLDGRFYSLLANEYCTASYVVTNWKW